MLQSCTLFSRTDHKWNASISISNLFSIPGDYEFGMKACLLTAPQKVCSCIIEGTSLRRPGVHNWRALFCAKNGFSFVFPMKTGGAQLKERRFAGRGCTIIRGMHNWNACIIKWGGFIFFLEPAVNGRGSNQPTRQNLRHKILFLVSSNAHRSAAREKPNWMGFDYSPGKCSFWDPSADRMVASHRVAELFVCFY